MKITMERARLLPVVAMMLALGACSGGGNGGSRPPTQLPPATNISPTANAGADQIVNFDAAVTLSGTASADADGTIATYTWIQTSGPAVTLATANAASATFTAPAASGALAFQLTVTDNGGASHSDTVTVTVNAPPVANAGADRTVSAGAAVSLNGSGSDTDGTVATYLWTQTAGNYVVLNGAGTATLSFTAPATATTLTFQLVVTDNHGASHSDAVTVTVGPSVPPVPTAPAIVRQPTHPKTLEYGNALLFVVASGTDLDYEWHSRDFGTVVKSGPEPFLVRTNLTAGDDGRCYYVVVTNSLGTATSQDGCVTVWNFGDDAVPPLQIDPFDDNLFDDHRVAAHYANTLLAITQYVAGALTGPTPSSIYGLPGVTTGVPVVASAPRDCDEGRFVGATLDGIALTATTLLPLGRHTLSVVWEECFEASDQSTLSDGGLLIDYDFPSRFGEGTATFHFSGYLSAPDLLHLNGIVRTTLEHHDDGAAGRDDIHIALEEDLSTNLFAVTSASSQTIDIERTYDADASLLIESELDFDVRMTAHDSDGPAGAVYERPDSSSRIVLRFDEQDGPSTEGTMDVGFTHTLSGTTFHLADLEATHGPLSNGVVGWQFEVLPPYECPDGQICVDP